MVVPSAAKTNEQVIGVVQVVISIVVKVKVVKYKLWDWYPLGLNEPTNSGLVPAWFYEPTNVISGNDIEIHNGEGSCSNKGGSYDNRYEWRDSGRSAR